MTNLHLLFKKTFYHGVADLSSLVSGLSGIGDFEDVRNLVFWITSYFFITFNHSV